MIKYFKKFVISADPDKGGIINWLKSLGFQLIMTASIFTALQMFFELDKLFTGNDFNIIKLIVYFVLWFLISTKTYWDWKTKYENEKKKE